MIKSVIFDLDGTLLDTSEGIISSVEKMIDHFGYKKLTRAELETFIGPPISKSVIRIYGLSDEEALEAMKYYRVVYKAEPEDGSKPDLFRGSIYPGMEELLQKLRDDGYKVGVATYKPEHMAKALLEEKGLTKYFDVIHGADLEGKLKCRKFFIQNIVNTDNFKAEGIKKYGKLECSSEYTKEIYFAYHGRITTQKGLAVLTAAVPAILENYPDVRFIFAGQGEPRLEIDIVRLCEKYPGRVCFMNGYNQTVVRLATAVSDFIVLPSYFEPCGLEDFIAQVYGTVPIAHKTGGLNKIEDGRTGFLYESNTAGVLIAKLSEIIMLKTLRPSQIARMVKSGAYSVHHEYLWKTVIQKKYLPFFKEILKNSKE